MMFLTLHCSHPDILEMLNNLPAMFGSREQLSERALKLFQSIGKQICEDHGVPWGTTPADTDKIDDETALSEAAETRFQEFLEFITQHS